MSKRETYEIVTRDSQIQTKDKEKTYPADIIREVYIKTDATLEQMAKEYNLPLSTLERMARTGDNWHKLKEEYQNRRLDILSKRYDDILVEKQSTVQRLEEITLMKINLKLAEIEEHFKTWGDFFIRDVEGEKIYNSKGQAIELELPNSPKDLMALKALEDARVNNAILLQERLEYLDSKKDKVKELEDGKTIDIDSVEGLFNNE